MNNGRHLLIRVDGNSQVGFGHVMRSMALAQAWVSAGGEVEFAVAAANEKAVQRLRQARFEVTEIEAVSGSFGDAEATTRRVRDWALVDGYEFSDAFTATLKQSGARIAVIDDDRISSWQEADIILNQNLHARREMYAGTKAGEFCLGPEFVLLRREFVRAEKEAPKVARKILVTLGGGDQSQVAARIMEPFRATAWKAFEFIILSGGTIKPEANWQVIPTSDKMPDLIMWADIAISGAGSTVWELCFVGTPFITVVLAPNQEEIAASLEDKGLAEIAGKITSLNPESIAARVKALANACEKRQKISRSMRALVDGQGAHRVVSKMLAHPVAAHSH